MNSIAINSSREPEHLHADMTASAWVQRWTPLVAADSQVLDVACGHGRHMQWLQSLGHRVTGIDRSETALVSASRFGTTLQADIEQGPWPLPERQFGAVVVTNYLWRPLWPALRASVSPGGLMIYETFARGQETIGKPSRRDFLLDPGELLKAFAGWHVVAYENGFLSQPDRFVQRMVCVNGPQGGTSEHPARHPL
jgi:SAM-dependent methyltransferase